MPISRLALIWKVEWDDRARRELRRLDRSVQRTILRYISDCIRTPEDARHSGRALHSSLGELRRYRIGDYRIICRIEDARLIVLILRVARMPKIILFDNPAQPFPQTNGGNNNFEIFNDIIGRRGVYIFQDRCSNGILYVGKAYKQDLKDRITQNYTSRDSGGDFRDNWCEMENQNFDDFKRALSGWRIITMSVASGSDDGRSDGDWIHALEAVLIGFLRPRYNKS